MQYKIVQSMLYEMYRTQISLQRDFHTVVLNGYQQFSKVLNGSVTRIEEVSPEQLRFNG